MTGVVRDALVDPHPGVGHVEFQPPAVSDFEWPSLNRPHSECFQYPPWHHRMAGPGVDQRLQRVPLVALLTADLDHDAERTHPQRLPTAPAAAYANR